MPQKKKVNIRAKAPETLEQIPVALSREDGIHYRAISRRFGGEAADRAVVLGILPRMAQIAAGRVVTLPNGEKILKGRLPEGAISLLKKYSAKK